MKKKGWIVISRKGIVAVCRTALMASLFFTAATMMAEVEASSGRAQAEVGERELKVWIPVDRWLVRLLLGGCIRYVQGIC